MVSEYRTIAFDGGFCTAESSGFHIVVDDSLWVRLQRVGLQE